MSSLQDAVQRFSGAAKQFGSDLIADLAIITSKIAALAVTNAKLANTTIQSEKASVFFSAVITADGTSQSTAHGLGRAPAIAIAYLVKVAAAGDEITTVVKDNLTVDVTAVAGCKFRIIAW